MRLHQRLRRDQGRHTDDWLITYADTITLLLCLFVVILSIKTNGESPPRGLGVPAAQAVGLGDVVDLRPPFRSLPLAQPEDDSQPAAIVEPPPVTIETPRPVTVAAVAPTAVAPIAVAPIAVAPVLAPLVVAPVPSPPTAVPRTVPRHGDRITTLQMSSAAFFASGDAVLSDPGKAILRDVAVTLKSAEYDAYRIAVEGHTDDSPINTTRFQSNWELSTARAAAVVRFFLEQGIPAARLTAAGYADTFPVAPNRTADGTVIPENQARNRRVVIKLEKVDKAEQSGGARQ